MIFEKNHVLGPLPLEDLKIKTIIQPSECPFNFLLTKSYRNYMILIKAGVFTEIMVARKNHDFCHLQLALGAWANYTVLHLSTFFGNFRNSILSTL